MEFNSFHPFPGKRKIKLKKQLLEKYAWNQTSFPTVPVIDMTMKIISLVILLLAMGTLTAVASGNRHPVARKLIQSQGCKACHSLEGAGGDFAAPLGGAANRLTPQECRALLEQGKYSPTEPFMPAYNHLLEKEMDQLMEFLLGLPPKP